MIDLNNLALFESGNDDLSFRVHGIQTGSRGIESETMR